MEVIALFGSAAAGRLGPESDLDVYVRLRRGARWPTRRTLEVGSELSGISGRELDLIIEDPDETSVILRREVARRGELLWEVRPGACTTLRAEAMTAYADLEPLMRRCGEGVRRRILGTRRG